jgi:hypothetical protein
MVTMVPRWRSFMPGRKALMVRKVVVRLASSEACQPSSGISSTGPGRTGLPPALATSTLTGPRLRSMAVRMASIS